MSSNSSTSAQYVAYLNSLSDQIIYYYLVTVMPLGLVGNVISIYIYSRPSLNKKTNTGFLYIWLCIVNIFSTIWYGFITRSFNIINYTFAFPCGIELFVRRSNFMTVSWMQVFISLDRFVAVVFPHSGVMQKLQKKVNEIINFKKNKN